MRQLRLMSGRKGIAFFATYMLVLQALLGAFALGSSAASTLLDAFGHPLCITSTDINAVDHSDRGEHNAMPDCCTVACSMFAAVGSDERSSNSLSNPLASSPEQAQTSYEVVIRVFALERGPRSPRSPPLTV